MNNSPLTTGLTVMVCLLSAVVLFLTCVREIHLRTMRGLQPVVANAQSWQNRITALATETVEYSMKNPSIDPILQPLGLKPGNQPVTNKPAGK
jgi:hypothetical protein